MGSARYDEIGHGYAALRREDPRIAARLHAALGDARTVVNLGAGAGSYEPLDRAVVAIEPSAVMAAQRPADRPPAILASAGRLPLVDDAVDAAMAVLTVHHWDGEQEADVRVETIEVPRGTPDWTLGEARQHPSARAPVVRRPRRAPNDWCSSARRGMLPSWTRSSPGW